MDVHLHFIKKNENKSGHLLHFRIHTLFCKFLPYLQIKKQKQRPFHQSAIYTYYINNKSTQPPHGISFSSCIGCYKSILTIKKNVVRMRLTTNVSQKD